MTGFALLFDLDGTLVDTDHLHYTAFATVLFEERGEALSLADYRTHVMGHPNSQILGHYFPDRPERHAEIIERKEAMVRAELAAGLTPVAGIHALLDWAASARAGTAVVTNAPRINAEAMLAASGLQGRLGLLVIGEECIRPKPDPAPYQEAMRGLGVSPSQAVAFEDSRSGLRAARDSGARVFGLTTGLTSAELLQAGAHQAIADFTDPALWAYLLELRARVA